MDLTDLIDDKPKAPRVHGVSITTNRHVALITRMAREGRLEWTHREAQRLAKVVGVSVADLALACGLAKGFGLDRQKYRSLVEKKAWKGPVAVCLSHIRDSVSNSCRAQDVPSLGVKTSILSLTND